ncbi:MAG TPA: methyltransferase domain-containing protein [Thermoleophilaceae bacterium]|nr:methyltransferase domain-containing protein [Thermoleophilaceae bacterium]
MRPQRALPTSCSTGSVSPPGSRWQSRLSSANRSPRCSSARREDVSRIWPSPRPRLRERDLGGQARSPGWQVTGVDFVPKALRRARERAAEAGVELKLLEGDVTALASAGVGSGFQLLVDFGCFHDELSDAQRAEEGRGSDRGRRPRCQPPPDGVGSGAKGAPPAWREPLGDRGRLP